MADIKSESMTWVDNNFGEQCGCFWESISDAEDGKQCRRHKGRTTITCTLPQPGEVDMCVLCGPCQSVSRCKRGGLPEEHPLFGVLVDEHGSICSVVRKIRPKCVVSENVLGLNDTRKKGRFVEQSPLEEILYIFYQVADDDGNRWFIDHVVLHSDIRVWMKGSRPRPDSTGSAWVSNRSNSSSLPRLCPDIRERFHHLTRVPELSRPSS